MQTKLTTLDLSNNRIARIENVRHLVEMEEFWVSVACVCVCVYVD